ncbi:MAG: NAD(P)-dependent oxidoreductase [Gammaproteobacteria bacterium]|nr:NAD(P)-dependent oxidoreductase [Gammaproteobacteria bacterium]
MKTGFIGLGAMGAPMARNLARAGLLHRVWNRTAERAAALAADTGCRVSPTPADLARDCEAVMLCVSADADVAEVVAALEPTLRPGMLVIDHSTVGAATARTLGTRLAARGVDFLDAPVSGGVEGARQGTLAVMVGGSAAAFERARPLLGTVGRTLTRFGPLGAGQTAKATNQIIVAGLIRAIGEALAFARAGGLDLDKVVETLGGGAAASWYLAHRGPFMARGEYPAGFRVRLHAKDLRICREMAREHGVVLPVIEETLSDYQRLIDQGHGDEDIAAIYRIKAALFASAGGS